MIKETTPPPPPPTTTALLVHSGAGWFVILISILAEVVLELTILDLSDLDPSKKFKHCMRYFLKYVGFPPL